MFAHFHEIPRRRCSDLAKLQRPPHCPWGGCFVSRRTPAEAAADLGVDDQTMNGKLPVGLYVGLSAA
jgi:hypothetical protein